ncbi:MBOAT family O-acyltransferase [Mesorhizobium sp. CAU 1741]|uniref:MBOAT family O-acyltransferase n=1 Tax=Mesorhizobium sp. CAU 1741 TaxID=3140366 RepID=UPI00325B5DBF
MAFNSIEYVLFFATVIVVYFIVNQRFRLDWLLTASLFFYASADPVLIVHFIIVIVVTYFLALRIDAQSEKDKRKRWMLIAVGLLVFNLFIFKYTMFLSDTLRSLSEASGVPYPVPTFRIMLPIGISFYTFSLISYVIDIQKGMPAERRFRTFALYASFFPKIVAGPIERAKKLIPQFDVPHSFDYERAYLGLQLILWGAFKKIVVADNIAPFVARVYDNPQGVDGVAVVAATVLYAFQLYCDFSGYTDIAIGSALMMGFHLSPNFNRPYIATSIQDYWKRWHISLSSWLTEYVYTPMSRTTWIKMKWYNLMLLSLFATFVVSGLWHGAQWTFVVWGALHGSYIVISQLTQKQRGKLVRFVGLNKYPSALRAWKIGCTFTLVCLAYILFRSSNLADAAELFARLPIGWMNPIEGLKIVIAGYRTEILICIAGIGVVLLIEAMQGKAQTGQIALSSRWMLNYTAATAIILFGALYQTDQQFIYFQF